MRRSEIRGEMPHVRPARLPLSAFYGGPAPMAVGLAVLSATAIWPAVPAVTALALVALGATQLTLARFRAEPALSAMVAMHLVTYAGLYGLFVAATLDAAGRRGAGLGPVAFVDMLISLYPLAIAWQQCRKVLLGGPAS